jgi:ketosteroid isomerase-like protein
MYHFIVRKTIIRAFRDLSAGNHEAVLNQFSPDIHFLFEGDHALGSELHSLNAVRGWFQRVFRLFPGLQFKVKQVIVSGWPWDTTAATRLQVEATLRNGQHYQNSVVQFVRLRWGRVIDDYLLENTQKLVAVLKEMAQQGVDEAIAPPIEDQ